MGSSRRFKGISKPFIIGPDTRIQAKDGEKKRPSLARENASVKDASNLQMVFLFPSKSIFWTQELIAYGFVRRNLSFNGSFIGFDIQVYAYKLIFMDRHLLDFLFKAQVL